MTDKIELLLGSVFILLLMVVILFVSGTFTSNISTQDVVNETKKITEEQVAKLSKYIALQNNTTKKELGYHYQSLDNQKILISKINTAIEQNNNISKEILRLSNEHKINEMDHINISNIAKTKIEHNVNMTIINAKNIQNILNNITDINNKLTQILGNK